MRTLLAIAAAVLLTTGPAHATRNLVTATASLALDGHPDQRIAVQTFVPREPRALVVYTHGFLDNLRNHRRLYGVLLARGCAVAAWDLVGHGESYGMRGHVERFDDYVRALHMVRAHAARKVPAGTPVILLGHSLGALVTLRAVEEQPDAVAASAYLAPFLEAKLTPVRKLLNGMSGMMDHIFPKLESPHGVTNEMMFREPEILAERRTDRFFFEKITVHLFRQMLIGIREAFADVNRLTKPMLFLVAGDEQVVERAATDRFWAKVPAADKTYKLFPAARHELHSDLGRAEVLGTLIGWVEVQLRQATFGRVHAQD